MLLFLSPYVLRIIRHSFLIFNFSEFRSSNEYKQKTEGRWRKGKSEGKPGGGGLNSHVFRFTCRFDGWQAPFIRFWLSTRASEMTRVYKIVAEGGRGAQPPSTHPSPPYTRQSPLQYHKCAFSYFLTQWTNCSTDGPKEGRTKSLIGCVSATKKEKQKPEMFEFTTAV